MALGGIARKSGHYAGLLRRTESSVADRRFRPVLRIGRRYLCRVAASPCRHSGGKA